ncbi:GNAT family N-acetyltransferase [Streptomyces sp. NPDC047315]|uniref:GNAT family N-acetyltransferase n=1 Tax=Streptomyces sp. NPDC047315 TaxID=3155142 RepID=UPI0033DB18AE
MQTERDHAYPDHWEADVVLRDGGTARIRPITVDDADRLVSFYEQVSDESKYYRFFAPYPHLSPKDVHRFTHHDYVDRVGLAVTVGGEFVATVRYDRIDEHGRPASAPADEAEVAFLVQDAHHGRGVASTMLEHIAAVARERGIRRFAADVLPANTKMIKVFRDAGYTQKRSFEDGSVHLTLDLEPTAESVAVQRAREHRAEARSVQRLLAPRAVAVVGVGRAPGGVGRTVLRDLVGGGYTGRAYAVNRAFPADWHEVDGVPAHRSVGEVVERTGEPVDLVVVAVPAERVPEVVADCGEHGVRGLVVLSAGYAESGAEGRARQRELVRQARSYGMRVIGPNSFGVISTAADVRLNASLAPEAPAPGRIGLFTQSGAIGIALLSSLHRRGGGLAGAAGAAGVAGDAGVAGVAGVSTFVSSGNRADVSGNDFLQYWYEDPDTDVALLYLESIGNPRKFTRLARRTAAVKPVVVVKGARHSGSEPPGHAVPSVRIPDAAVDALLRQAGVIRVDTVTELVDAGLLLAGQPLPAGPRVAILGNSESLGLLTYDSCLAEGLRPLPPLDLTTAASAADFREALAGALADDGCDAVVVNAIPRVGDDGATEFGDGTVLAAALREAVATAPAKPVAVVHVELGGLAAALTAATTTAPAGAGGPGGPRTAAAGPQPRPGEPGLRPAGPDASGADRAADAPSGEGSHGSEGPASGVGSVRGSAGASPAAGGTQGPAAGGDRGNSAAGPRLHAGGDAEGSVPAGSGRAVSAGPGAGVARGGPADEGGPGSPGAGAPPGAGGFPHGPGGPTAGAGPVRGAADGSPTAAGDHSPAGDGGEGPAPRAGTAGAGRGAAASHGERADGADTPASARAGVAAAGTLGGWIPAYPAAERAVRALSEAVRYAQWRRQAAEPGKVPEYEDVDEAGAAARIEALLDGDVSERGITLGAADAGALLATYGIHVRPTLPAPDADAAVRAAERLGYPLALKTTAPHLRHRADLGGVRLDLAGEAQVRRAYRELTDLLGDPVELQPVVQAMAPRGVDTVVRAVVDPAVGAYLSFGLAGVASELLGDTAHRLVPVTDRDAAEQIRSIRTAPLLFGWRGSAPVDTAALEELLLRVSRIVDDHPEVVAIGLEPVVVAPRGLSVLGATVRLAPSPAPADLGPRRLPSY